MPFYGNTESNRRVNLTRVHIDRPVNPVAVMAADICR